MDTKRVLTCATQLALLRNGEHFQFNQDVVDDVPQETADTYHFGTQRAAYEVVFKMEDVVYKQNQGYALTADITSLNDKRKNLFLFLKGVIDANIYCPTESKQQAATVLKYAIKPYRSANVKSYSEMTAELGNLVRSLKEEHYAPLVTELGLDDIVTQLETINTEFNAIFKERSDKKRDRKGLQSMTSVRQDVDKAFLEMINAINVIYQANEMIQKDEETRTALGGVIDKINSLIIEINEKLARRGRMAKIDVPTDPDTPKPVTPAITAVYQVEGGNPDKPNEIKKGEKTRMEWVGGFELVNETGDGPGDIILRNDMGLDDTVRVESILERSNKYCEFIMTEDLTEGEYEIRIETYDGGKPLVVKYPEKIKLNM